VSPVLIRPAGTSRPAATPPSVAPLLGLRRRFQLAERAYSWAPERPPVSILPAFTSRPAAIPPRSVWTWRTSLVSARHDSRALRLIAESHQLLDELGLALSRSSTSSSRAILARSSLALRSPLPGLLRSGVLLDLREQLFQGLRSMVCQSAGSSGSRGGHMKACCIATADALRVRLIGGRGGSLNVANRESPSSPAQRERRRPQPARPSPRPREVTVR
jgi:hypothetical protein